MKKYVILLLLCATFSCNNSFKGNYAMRKIEFYYAPWSLRRESSLTENDLQNLGDNLISYYCISKKEKIRDFFSTLKNPKIRKTSLKYREPFMIIEMSFFNHKSVKIAIDEKLSFFKFVGKSQMYFLNPEAKRWIEEHVPSAVIPGIRISDCTDL